MIVKSITFKDFRDQKVTEEFYFHLSVRRFRKWNKDRGGDLMKYLKEVDAKQDSLEALDFIEELIARSFGTRSEDGRHFDQDEAATEEFLESPAYDALLAELGSSKEAAGEFVSGIFTSELIRQGLDMAAGQEQVTVTTETVELPAADVRNDKADPEAPQEGKLPWADREPTPEELRKMSQAQLIEVYRRKVHPDY